MKGGTDYQCGNDSGAPTDPAGTRRVMEHRRRPPHTCSDSDGQDQCLRDITYLHSP